MRIGLIIIYPLLLAARLLQTVLGRDPLRLREPRDESLWIVRNVEPDRQSYFSAESAAEGRAHGGLGWIAASPLRALARCFAPAPPRKRPNAAYSPAVDREEGIPDEVYTLW